MLFVPIVETIDTAQQNRKGRKHMIFKEKQTISGIYSGVHHYGHHRIELIGTEEEKAYILINDTEHALKIYYRPERTWDDHMGNTPCGSYVNLPFPDGTKKRAYLF